MIPHNKNEIPNHFRRRKDAINRKNPQSLVEQKLFTKSDVINLYFSSGPNFIHMVVDKNVNDAYYGLYKTLKK